jgi:hypothetical protein
VVAAVAAAAAMSVGAGCADDGPDDPADALADRVSAILEEDGGAVLDRLQEGGLGVDAEALGDAEVVCPQVRTPDPGDRATCRVVAGDLELEVDVEFTADGGLQVVQVAVAP